MAKGGRGEVDELLAARVARFSRGSQRWLKTVIYSLTTSEASSSAESSLDEPPAPRRPKGRPPRKAASLEDVVTGKADLREHLEDYPELSEDLEGIAEIIDLLRETGERRRRKGEQILREEILGENAEQSADTPEPE